MYKQFLRGIIQYGSTVEDIFKAYCRVPVSAIHPQVILAPWWEPARFPAFSERASLVGESASVKVWEIATTPEPITYIKTGIGAPLIMDAVLMLGLAHCQQVVFIGSVGALVEEMGIGDIVLPEYSVCGDGASRYLLGSPLQAHDPFGGKSYPHPGLYAELKAITQRVCSERQVALHAGHTFSIDTVFAQFTYLEEIKALGCNVIEMETAAAFRAAQLAGVPLAALFSVSDNSTVKKSLISGRTAEEQRYRKEVRRTIFPQILLEVFGRA